MKLVVLNDRPRRVTVHVIKKPCIHGMDGKTACGKRIEHKRLNFIDHGQELFLCGNCERTPDWIQRNE